MLKRRGTANLFGFVSLILFFVISIDIFYMHRHYPETASRVSLSREDVIFTTFEVSSNCDSAVFELAGLGGNLSSNLDRKIMIGNKQTTAFDEKNVQDLDNQRTNATQEMCRTSSNLRVAAGVQKRVRTECQGNATKDQTEQSRPSSVTDKSQGKHSVTKHKDRVVERQKQKEEEWQKGLTKTVAAIVLGPSAPSLNLSLNASAYSGSREDDFKSRNRPRAALCFFGQVKNIDVNQIHNLTEQVVKPLLEEYSSIDVYLHTYNIQTFNSPRNMETEASLDVAASIELLVSKLQKVTSHDQIRIINLKISDPHEADISFRPLTYYLAYGDPWRNYGVSLFYLLRQLYSLDQVTELWENKCDPDTLDKEYYQGVVYLRPDLLFFDRLDVVHAMGTEQIDTTKTTSCLIENNTISIPHFDRHKGLNDRFAIGCPSIMRIYGHRMHAIDEFFMKYPNESLWAEPFLKKVMVEMHGVNYNPMKNFLFTRVRADGHYKATR